MDFALSAEQELLRDTLTRVLDDCAPLERVRAIADDAGDRGDDVWAALVELGLPGMLIAEEFGGIGLGAVDAALVAETLGQHVTPAPWIASAVVVPTALRLAGSAAQRERWLPRIAGGELRVGLALSEHTGAREGAAVTASERVLDGRSLFVVDFAADAYLVAASDGGLYLVDRGAVGLECIDLVSVDRTRALGELGFNAVNAERLDGHRGADVLRTLIDYARVMTAADTLGAAQYMLDAAVAYAGERRQFGRVIGSFQAVKHLCAEMAAALEPCRAMVWYAAHALDTLPVESHLYACHTKAHLAEVGTQLAKTATEVHGGMGFTDLLGLHYWFKRIGLNRQLFGGPERARQEAALAQNL